MGRVTIIQFSGEVLTIQGIPHVPKVYHVRNNLVLLLFRQVRQLCFKIFQRHIQCLVTIQVLREHNGACGCTKTQLSQRGSVVHLETS